MEVIIFKVSALFIFIIYACFAQINSMHKPHERLLLWITVVVGTVFTLTFSLLELRSLNALPGL